MKSQPGETNVVIGSFEDAERQRAVAMARLTPAQRIRIVCDMHALNRQVTIAREKAGLAKRDDK